MIEVQGLTKTFGDTTAVNDLTFAVKPGVVTGFLGPNGAGKSTTMRLILGLDRPDAGYALVNGHPYTRSDAPLMEVGALLSAADINGARSARNHLRALAASNGIDRRRVDEVLALVGIENVARKRAKSFSLGMSQRLGMAAALLGDPPVLMFDEPINGLDPEGILWIRNLMRSLAEQDRTVLISSHLMSEMAVTADHLVVIGRGRLLADVSIDDFVSNSAKSSVRVRSPQAAELATAIRAQHGVHSTPSGDALELRGISCAEVGELAAAKSIALHELTEDRASLEAAFMEMTREDVEYRATTG